jgi:hypothetical protein
MCNITTDIDREIDFLIQERDRLTLYWFELGEADRTSNLPPSYSENYWYLLGWHDRDYQIEIAFQPESSTFEHF